MRKFYHILFFSVLLINMGYGQCQGDTNLDNTIDEDDILIVVIHILGMEAVEGAGFTNGDVDGNGTINVFDLVAIVDISLSPEIGCD